LSRRRNKIERDSCFSHVNLFGLKPTPILRQLLHVKQRPYGTLPSLSTLCVAGTACLWKLIKGGSCNQLRQQKSLSFTTKDRVQVKISPRDWWQWGERHYLGSIASQPASTSACSHKSHDPLPRSAPDSFLFREDCLLETIRKKWWRIQLKCNKEWCTMDSLIFFYFSWGTQLFKNMMKKTKAKCFSVWSSGRILGWRLMAGCWERWMPACHLLQNKTTAIINKNWRYAVKLW
jgi:hypothetical protein